MADSKRHQDWDMDCKVKTSIADPFIWYGYGFSDPFPWIINPTPNLTQESCIPEFQKEMKWIRNTGLKTKKNCL